MLRLLALALTLLAVGALIANATDRGWASHGDRMVGQLAQAPGHSHHEPGDSHDDPAHQGALHCVTFHCATPFLVQATGVQTRTFDRSAAFLPVGPDDVLHSAIVERDPPIPRLSA